MTSRVPSTTHKGEQAEWKQEFVMLKNVACRRIIDDDSGSEMDVISVGYTVKLLILNLMKKLDL